MRTPGAPHRRGSRALDIEGQQDQHTPLGTATACISEWLLEYSTEQHGLGGRGAPRKQETQGGGRSEVRYSLAVWPPHRLQRANCGLQWANCVSCDGPITWRGAVTTATKVSQTHPSGWPRVARLALPPPGSANLRFPPRCRAHRLAPEPAHWSTWPAPWPRCALPALRYTCPPQTTGVRSHPSPLASLTGISIPALALGNSVSQPCCCRLRSRHNAHAPRGTAHTAEDPRPLLVLGRTSKYKWAARRAK